MAFEIVSTLIRAFTRLDSTTLLPQHRFNSTLSTGSAIEIGGIAFVVGVQSGTTTFGSKVLTVLGSNDAAFLAVVRTLCHWWSS